MRSHMDESLEYVLLLQKQLKEVLQEKRYLHTLGVAYMAASLAMCYGISHRKALIAGLLHDCAKEYSDTELLKKCLELELPVSLYERKVPHLLHGVYGAYLAQYRYGVSDEEILNAIKYHTIGRPDMSKLEQIVFLADYLEPERRQPAEPSLDELRTLAFHDMDKATLLVTENTIRYFKSMEREMDPATEDVLSYYRKKTEEVK